MNSKFKPDPQKVVEFMCDAICRDNEVTGKIDFNEGFVTIFDDDGVNVWKSTPFSVEYEQGMRVEYLKSVFDLVGNPEKMELHQTDLGLFETMAEIAGMTKSDKPN